MSGLLGEYARDVASASDDPFSMPDGTYHGAIVGFERRSGNRQSDNKPWAALVAKLSAEGDSRGYEHFMSLPSDDDTAAAQERKLSNIKTFLKSLEIPESRFETLAPSDVIGLEIDYQLKTSKNGFRNLSLRLSRGSAVQADQGMAQEMQSAMASMNQVTQQPHSHTAAGFGL